MVLSPLSTGDPILLGIVMFFIYWFIWRRFKVIGDLLFGICGYLIITTSSSIATGLGIIVMGISFLLMWYHFIKG